MNRPQNLKKKSPTCFDKTAVFTQQCQNKWDYGLFRKAGLLIIKCLTHKVEKNLPLVLTLLSKNSCFVKTGGRFFQILWPSHNVLTLPDLLKNVAWHESNHFGGKKIEKQNSRPSYKKTKVLTITPWILHDESIFFQVL